VERLNLWLEQYLADLLYAHDQAADTQQALGDFLQKTLSMAEFTRVRRIERVRSCMQWLKTHLVSQELLPAFEKFLAHYLGIWNGHDHKELIFKLIAFIKPASYDGK
jgi:deoxyxylulose-5-phosphate synthase